MNEQMREGVKKKLDFLRNMSPKLWPRLLSAHLGDKEKSEFLSFFYKYFIRAYTIIQKKKIQGMLNIFYILSE